MKKNRMMRLASVLMVAVMMTTCTISGTFAKYVTSADANDSARVAKWGVTVTAQSEEVFGEKYDNQIEAAGTKVVSSVLTEKDGEGNVTQAGQDVLAPGTTGDLGSIAITGTPEVMVDITAAANLMLTGWEVDGTYCPLVFTVGADTFKIGDGTCTDVATLEAAVEAAFVAALEKNDVPANTNLADSIGMTWDWPFYTGEDADKNDTALGDRAAAGNAPTISFSYSATVTQVD